MATADRRTTTRRRRLVFDADPRMLAAEPGIATDLADGDLEAGFERPDQTITILRALDLVHLRVDAYGTALVTDASGPALVPIAEDARLVVRFAFQHVADQAFLEIEGEPAELVLAPPIGAVVAEPSRLVLAIGPGERVPYEVAGLLAAITRLPLLVAPLAQPRRSGPIGVGEWWLHLPGDLVLARTADGFAISAAARAVARARSTDPLERLLADAAGLRTARRLLATTPATVTVSGLAAGDRAVDVTGSGVAAPRFVGDLALEPPARWRPLRQAPRAPLPDETAIEAPYRLLLSPSVRGGFTHATAPVGAVDDDSRIELWHTRLGVRRELPDGSVEIDERDDPQRSVRAVWTRDLEDSATENPFRMSLDPNERRGLVRQSADPREVPPQPVEARRLHLSALGAWLDLKGQWDTEPYDFDAKASQIESWIHVAPMGRDQYVRVTEPGYLFPFGHRAVVIKITYRKFYEDAGTNGPQAYLFQRFFIQIREPERTYAQHVMPLREVRVRPLVTPDLDDPDRMPRTPLNPHGALLFWPSQFGEKFVFTLTGLDWEGKPFSLRAPLLFVGEDFVHEIGADAISAEYAKDDTIPAFGQSVAFARATRPADTALETQNLRFAATAEATTATPRLATARVVVPAMRHLAPTAPDVKIEHDPIYVSDEFAGGNAAGQVFVRLVPPSPGQDDPNVLYPVPISFSGGSDRAGGFISPDLPLRGLSRVQGAVGDPDTVAAGTFDAAAFLTGAIPKLFGLFELTDILDAAGVSLADAPAFVTEQLDQVSALVADAGALATTLEQGVDRLAQDAAAAPNAAVQGQIEAVRNTLAGLRDRARTEADRIVAELTDLLDLASPADLAAVTAALEQPFARLRDVVAEVAATLPDPAVPPALRALLERPTAAIGPLLVDAAKLLAALEAVVDFVNGFDPAGASVRARFEWRPRLGNWPTGASDTDAVFTVAPDGLLLAVDVRASGGAGAGMDVLAELRDFALNLAPGAPLMRLPFDRLAFRVRSDRKPEVDVVFRGIEYLGVLGFIDELRKIIPFDGFADPPYVDVSAEGVTAGFDLALPNVAVGVFSLDNISLGADARVPFLGEAVTVGFNFCTKDRPFRLTVMMIGGGGFVAVRLSPKGLVVLEMALEAGACLSINLGVASGSVSIMVGVYLRLEDDGGSLTGYFRIRGEVDVLGLISASITLELSLTYDFDTGKMVGRASITVEVEVLCFSASVEISVEKQLAGSKGDPTLEQVMPPEPDGTSPAWSAYCQAFAEG